MPSYRVVSKCISAPVNSVQPPSLDRMTESFLGVAELPQLPHRDNAMLLSCEHRQSMVTSPFRVHTDY